MNTIRLNTIGEVVKKIESGSGGGSGERDWKYFSVPSSLDAYTFANIMAVIPTFVKLKDEVDGIYFIGTAGMFGMLGIDEAKKRCVAIGSDMDAKMLTPSTLDALMSFKDIETQFGQSLTAALLREGFSEISEEEFYNLEGGITNDFVSIRELYQPTKEEVDLIAEPQLLNTENCDRVSEVIVNFATEYEDVGTNGFYLFDVSNSQFMGVSVFTNEYVGMKCIFALEGSEYSSYTPFVITSDGTITKDENAVKEINSILANGDFRYISDGNVFGLTDANFNIIDRFIKVKTV